jgi:AraC-like DNA-binding protein
MRRSKRGRHDASAVWQSNHPGIATVKPETVRDAFAVEVASAVFAEIGIGVSLFQRGRWYPIHHVLGVSETEAQNGLIADRYAYNGRCIRRVEREAESIIGEHAGYQDLFVPLRRNGQGSGVLVAGPFSRKRPTGGEIVERWRILTHRQAQLADPEFSEYLAMVLSTPALEGEQLDHFQELLGCLAVLMTQDSAGLSVASDIDWLRDQLMEVRFSERVWEVAKAMVDQRTSRAWADPSRLAQWRDAGMTAFPEHAVVGLFTSSQRDANPIDEVVRGNAFQRACVGLARASGSAVSGKVGDNGITFLVQADRSPLRTRRRLLELSKEAVRIAKRRFGLSLHVGVSALEAPLPRQYQAALGAAEAALARRATLVHAETAAWTPSPLFALRRELAKIVDESPRALVPRFDRFVETVAARSAYRPESARAHLEATFERLTEVTLGNGTLDPKTVDALHEGLERTLGEASTLTEVLAAYRATVKDLVAAVEDPGHARHDHGLRRAEEFLRHHYAEPIGLKQVARAAGFAPNYFSELFHAKRGTTFGSYLTALRLDRVKQLLTATSLSLRRIAKLSGFSRSEYLNRVFKKHMSETPLAYRRRARRLRPHPKALLKRIDSLSDRSA